MSDEEFDALVSSLEAPMWCVEPVDLQRIAKNAAAAIKGLRADAARYKAIRNGCGADLYHALNSLDGHELDAAIDEAMRGVRQTSQTA